MIEGPEGNVIQLSKYKPLDIPLPGPSFTQCEVQRAFQQGVRVGVFVTACAMSLFGLIVLELIRL